VRSSPLPSDVIVLQANGGASCGVTYDECHALLSQYGKVARLVMIGLSPFAVAEFETPQQSAACAKGLDAFEWNRGDAAASSSAGGGIEKRQLFVQYAQMNASIFLDESKHPLQMVNARPLEEISPLSVCTLERLPEAVRSGVLDRGIVPGMLLIPDFLSAEEETRLLDVSCVHWQQREVFFTELTFLCVLCSVRCLPCLTSSSTTSHGTKCAFVKCSTTVSCSITL
jgi:hypothetical protein